MILVRFQGKPFNTRVIQVSVPTTDEEAEVDHFYEDLEDFPELTLKNNVLFTIGDWKAKAVSQGIPAVTYESLALEYKMKQGKG